MQVRTEVPKFPPPLSLTPGPLAVYSRWIADTVYLPFPYNLVPFPEPFTPVSRTVCPNFPNHLLPAPLLFTPTFRTVYSRFPYRLLPVPVPFRKHDPNQKSGQYPFPKPE